MMRYLDGKRLSETVLARLKRRVGRMRRKPHLAIVLVGNDPGSLIYVRRKVAAAKRIGVRASVFRFPKQIGENKILKLIERLNRSRTVDGMIVQLPLPAHLDDDRIVLAINPKKDADGFHLTNLSAYLAGRPGSRMPGVIRGILLLIRLTRRPVRGMRAIILANSQIFSDPLMTALARAGLKVERLFPPFGPASPRDERGSPKGGPPFRNVGRQTRRADVLVAAIGQPNLVKGPMIKRGAIVVDVGFNRRGKRVVGDIDERSVRAKAGWLTPVPGGVGPMTVAMLLERLVELSRRGRR